MERISNTYTVRQLRLLLLLVVMFATNSGCGTSAEIHDGISEQTGQRSRSEIRVMSWNVKRNSILPPNGVRHDSFGRIVRAIDPDVIALQEVMWPGLERILKQQMNHLIPLEAGRSWHVHTVSDNAVISRFPMQWRGGELAVRYPLPHLGVPNFHFGFAAALLAMPDNMSNTDLLVVAMHNKSGAKDHDVQLRQVHADSIVRWIRQSRDKTQANFIADDTPIVILGDMNAVPNASMAPLETLLSGDIADEETFGLDSSIDWDGSDMADAKPSHNTLGREYYTWRNDDLPFPPSALDRILYTDSVMTIRSRFVLNTTTMSPTDLANLELQKSDALYDGNPRYYDHLPLVVDFEIRSTSSQ